MVNTHTLVKTFYDVLDNHSPQYGKETFLQYTQRLVKEKVSKDELQKARAIATKQILSDDAGRINPVSINAATVAEAAAVVDASIQATIMAAKATAKANKDITKYIESVAGPSSRPLKDFKTFIEKMALAERQIYSLPNNKDKAKKIEKIMKDVSYFSPLVTILQKAVVFTVRAILIFERKLNSLNVAGGVA
jgi:hypothetical protein